MSARILVVDDEANIRALIEEILSEEGYEVDGGRRCARTRAPRARTHDFDLILLDIWMPDTDGISLLKEWSESGAAGTVVMMSGHGTVDTAVEATRLGAVDFIEKPVSLAKLLRTVEKALAVRRAQGATSAPRHRCRPRRPARAQPMRALREQIARVAQHDAPVCSRASRAAAASSSARYLASQSRAGARTVRRRRWAAISATRARSAQLLGEGAEAGRARARRRRHAVHPGARRRRRQAAQRLLLGALEQRSYRPADQTADRPLNVRILIERVPGVRAQRRALRPRAAVAPERRRDSRAAAARVRRGRARAAALPRRPARRRRGACRSGVSASRRRIGCATTRGRATCASCKQSREAPADPRRRRGDLAGGGRGAARQRHAPKASRS